MRKLMGHIYQKRFAPDHKWSKRELKAVTPEKIFTYLKIKIYGSADADPENDPPLHHRRNTVLYWKKAWSYFMLDQMTPWSEIAKHGNPTKSVPVNKLLRCMNKMEAARRGKPSQARRALLPAEFESIILGLKKQPEEEVGVWLAAYLSFMYNMIARLDDTAKFRSPDLQPFHQFTDYGVTAKLCWTKNCMEERDLPTQILFGSRDWRYCVVSLFATWLEFHFEVDPQDNEFFFGARGASDPDTIKSSAAYYLQKLCKNDHFLVELMDEIQGQTGTHSVRKFAMNKVRGNGCTKDDGDHRGRWKSADRQQDTYSDTTIPFVDAKAAAALCSGGPVAYLVRSGSGITDEWILDHVVPHMVDARVPPQVCVVLGRALLWKVAEQAKKPDDGHNVPRSIMARVTRALSDLGDRNSLPLGTNPVRRANLGVTGLDSQVHVFEILGGDDVVHGVSGEPGAVVGGRPRHEQGVQDAGLRFMASEIQRLRREQEDGRNESARRELRLQAQIRVMQKTLARVAAQPGRRVVVAREGETGEGLLAPAHAQPRLVAELTPRPKVLHELWKEWLVGCGGKKAAKDFTAHERGRVKTMYSFRKVFWDKCGAMVDAGYSADVACDMIHQAYGQRTSVSKILRQMGTDRKNGTWPESLIIRRH